MNYKIITDSASDLPPEIIKEYQLHVIPTPVVINEKTYLDGETIKTGEFYSLLDKPENDIKTFHINPHMFEEAFIPYAKADIEVIYICFSTGIAATFNAANIAKDVVLGKYPDFKITIIDSKCASIGFGLFVYKLLQMQSNGASPELVKEAASFYRSHIKHIFTVETLEYLIKGGRIGKVTGGVAETLSIKPVITMDEAGSLKVYKLIRGRKASINALVAYVKENGADVEKQTIALCHGEDIAGLKRVEDLVQDILQSKKRIVSIVGCAIGAHTGRGVVGICFLDASEQQFEDYLDD